MCNTSYTVRKFYQNVARVVIEWRNIDLCTEKINCETNSEMRKRNYSGASRSKPTRVNTYIISTNDRCNIAITHCRAKNCNTFFFIFMQTSFLKAISNHLFFSLSLSLTQATSYGHSARLSGSCVQLDKNGATCLPFKYPERWLPVAPASGRIDTTTKDC